MSAVAIKTEIHEHINRLADVDPLDPLYSANLALALAVLARRFDELLERVELLEEGVER